MKSKLSHIPHNQYHSRVHTKGLLIELKQYFALLSIFLQSAVMSLFVGGKLEFLENFNIFVILSYELPNRILILGKSEDFFFTFFFFFWKVLDDFLSQVHLRGSNVHSKFYNMFLTNEKHKTQSKQIWVVMKNQSNDLSATVLCCIGITS